MPTITEFKKNEPTLEELQEVVGGYIQVVTSKDDSAEIVMDEEGKLKSKPINIPATIMWLGTNRDEWYDVIVGDVAVCKDNARLT